MKKKTQTTKKRPPKQVVEELIANRHGHAQAIPMPPEGRELLEHVFEAMDSGVYVPLRSTLQKLQDEYGYQGRSRDALLSYIKREFNRNSWAGATG